MENNQNMPEQPDSPDNDTENITQPEIIQTMEVHHHPDLHHKRKKFKEYFLEFLMIFLAVTLGFFAESLRENIGDNNKEHEYMQSLLNNMREDSTEMASIIMDNLEKEAILDSLIMLSAKDITTVSNRKLLYKYAGYISYFSVFKSNDATMLQLKNSGGLRMVKKHHVADSIARYDNVIKIIYAAEDYYNTGTKAAEVASHEILDYSIYYDTSYYKNGEFKPKLIPLLTGDPKKIKYFFNKVLYEKGATRNYVRNLKIRLPLVKNLIQYLQKEYDLE